MNELSHLMVEANGLRMHIAAQGEGPLVLLCHGFPETSYSWRHQLPALAEAGFRAVAPDLRGFGKTAGPTEIDRYTLFHLVGDMVSLLDALDARTAVIVGNDWGATLAWHLALMRPDRFHAVAAFGVPMMPSPPMAPGKLFPQTDDAQFYTLYFQPPGAAEGEFERDIRMALRKIVFAASGDAGPRGEKDGTPNPFGMVSRERGLLASLPDPAALPAWLTEADLDVLTEAFTASGFRGGLNLYRNMDRNWDLQRSLSGLAVTVPALYMVGERDTGLSIPGMREIISAMPRLVPRLTETIVLPGCGHWIQQERPDAVNTALVGFLRGLAPSSLEWTPEVRH
ncbi:alpha/beta fold hydrolase [Phreatobacter stygius]|uniref:Alpha/beta hydrolase n=1 Tax=Phreatobacter stygius TaxID=1940610 RepID=A0A4D7B5C3_9HYPH|nr:alpha/beta hydrolase [Phreatobacter stygius]QCI63207.1 alpha/beta hydrolase [Phreatobacter stygius]